MILLMKYHVFTLESNSQDYEKKTDMLETSIGSMLFKTLTPDY